MQVSGLSKEEILAGLKDVWTSVAALGATLADEEWDIASRCPGWTVRDLVSHMTGTELMLAGTPQPDVEVPDADHLNGDIAKFNESWVIERRQWSNKKILDEFETVVASRLETLERMSQAQFDEEAWTPAGHSTFGRFMQIRAFDCWMHEQDIRAAVGRPGHLDGPAVERSIAEISGSLGYVVGKRAGAPKGSDISLIVDGPTKRRFDLSVTDRARVVSTRPLNPTASVSTDLETFVALIGGRTDPAAALDAGLVSLGGDLELAEQVATHLAFVI